MSPLSRICRLPFVNVTSIIPDIDKNDKVCYNSKDWVTRDLIAILRKKGGVK